MKKLLLIFIPIFICIGIIIPGKVYAVDLTVGATTWYTWWDISQKSKREADPTFCYGPAIAVKFNEDFNLTFVYLHGRFEFTDSWSESGVTKTVTRKLKRNDSDLALNYRLNNYLKIFVGAKYMACSFTDMDWIGYGPGLGLSATVPLDENLFILATLSGFYAWGNMEESGV